MLALVWLCMVRFGMVQFWASLNLRWPSIFKHQIEGKKLNLHSSKYISLNDCRNNAFPNLRPVLYSVALVVTLLSLRVFNPLKVEINLNNVSKFHSYTTQNTCLSITKTKSFVKFKEINCWIIKNTECVNAGFSVSKPALHNGLSTRSANCFTDHLPQNIQPQITFGSNTVETNEAIEAGSSSFCSTTNTKKEKSSFTCILRILNMNIFFFYLPVPWVSYKQKWITFLSLF